MKRHNPEAAMQIALFEWISYQKDLRDHVLHIPNEGKRSWVYGKQLKMMGLRKGASDIFVALPRNGYHGAWIELKTEKGKPTKEQVQFLEDMKKVGYFTYVSYGLNDAMEIVKWYINDSRP